MKSGTWTRLDQVARRLLPFLITVGLVVLSQVPMHLPAAVSITPAFALISVYCWALHQPELMPAPLVFIVGLLQDILSGVPIGLNAFVLLIVYGLVVSQARYITGKAFGVLWWAFATLAVVIGVAQWCLMSLLAGQFISPVPVAVEYLTTAAIYPVVAYVFVLTHRSILREA